MSFCSKLIGQQHLGRGVTRSQEVFEQVSRVVPATTSVKISSGRQWPIRSPAIECMTDSVEPRIVATALLSHELEQLIGHVSIRGVANLKRERCRLADSHKILSRLLPGREIKFGMMIKFSPLSSDPFRCSLKDNLLRDSVDNVESFRQSLTRERDRGLWLQWTISELIDANEDLPI